MPSVRFLLWPGPADTDRVILACRQSPPPAWAATAVQTANAATVGLRELIPAKEVKEVYEILRSRDVPRDTQTWNRRSREYMEKIKTGSVFEIAEVLRDLSVLRATKELSFGERKMLDMARGLVVNELALAKGVGKDKIVAEIDAIFTVAQA